MKQFALLGAATCLLSMGLFGCNNTAEGAKEDASQNGQKVAAATDQAVDATKNAANNAADATKKAADSAGQATAQAVQDAGKTVKDAGAAAKDAADTAGQKVAEGAKETGKTMAAVTEVTPKVKLAIVADKDLNNPNNLINIDTKDSVVHITGHVQNNAEKKKASTIATETLKNMSATDKVSNELTVTSH